LGLKHTHAKHARTHTVCTCAHKHAEWGHKFIILCSYAAYFTDSGKE